MGYDTLYFGRMTDREREIRIVNQTMDFIWRPTFEGVDGPRTEESLPGLYTHLMYNTYTVPCGVPMTNYWNTDQAGELRQQFMDFLRSNDTSAQSYIQCMIDMANAYATDNVLVTWGYDFAYFDAINTFGLIDDIIAFMKEKAPDTFEFRYSTVSDYSRAVRKEFETKKLQLEVFGDDFFPMEEIYPDSFWTGYFSSRANSKRKMREFSALTYLSSTLYALDQFKLQPL
jgi:Glycosyl hydrolases family 38 N-terminal domain